MLFLSLSLYLSVAIIVIILVLVFVSLSLVSVATNTLAIEHPVFGWIYFRPIDGHARSIPPRVAIVLAFAMRISSAVSSFLSLSLSLEDPSACLLSLVMVMMLILLAHQLSLIIIDSATLLPIKRASGSLSDTSHLQVLAKRASLFPLFFFSFPALKWRRLPVWPAASRLHAEHSKHDRTTRRRRRMLCKCGANLAPKPSASV